MAKQVNFRGKTITYHEQYLSTLPTVSPQDMLSSLYVRMQAYVRDLDARPDLEWDLAWQCHADVDKIFTDLHGVLNHPNHVNYPWTEADQHKMAYIERHHKRITKGV